MTDDKKITLESIKARGMQRALATNPSTIRSFEESKVIFATTVRKSFFLIEAKLDAAKALWSGTSDLPADKDKVSLLLNEVIEYCKLFATYSCNPFSPSMRLYSREHRSSMFLLQAVMEKDKSKLVTPRPPLHAFRHILIEIRAIRSLIWSLDNQEPDDEEHITSLLTSLISHIEKVERTVEDLWTQHFPEPPEL
jgi:hypothetical protein